MTALGGDGSARSARVVLAVGIAALLVAALVAVVVLRGDGRGRGSDGASRGSGEQTFGGDGDGAGDGGAFDATPRHAVVGTARSLMFEGRLLGLTSLRVEGIGRVTVAGEILDAAGTVLGSGTVAATSHAHLTGATIDLETSGIRLRPGQPALAASAAGGSAGLTASSPGPIQLAGGELMFRPNDDEGRAEPRPVSGPVTVRPATGDIQAHVEGEQLSWVDVPDHVALAGPTSRRATLSWAGEGAIEVPGGGSVSAPFLGFKARRLQGELVREGPALRLTATASLQQVYADGAPQIRTTAAAVVKDVRRAAAGGRAWFRWAPENRGQHDMTITRIAPGNDAAAWVNLALDQLPEMCGGEPCPRHGGDTSGLGKRGSGGFLGFGSRSAQPIDAVILPGTGDESEVSVDVPAGTPAGEHTIVLVLEGNFDPVRVEITIPVD